jgi:hypothetical protein
LLESESVQRDSPKKRASGKNITADAEGGVGAGIHETVGALCADTHPGAYSGQDAYTGRLIPQPIGYRWQNNETGLVQDGTAPSCRASTGSSGFHEMNHPVVLQPFTKAKLAQSVTDDETWVQGQVNPTLSLFDQGDTRATTVAVGFNWQNGGGYGNANDGLGITVEGTGPLQRCNTPAVAHVETLPQQGYDAFHASTQETNAVATLRTLRSQIGEEAFAAWGLGILDSLQPQEVLRARLHGLGIRCATFSRSWPIDCAISRKEDRAAWAMQSMREAQGEGCSSLGWQLPQQLAAELGAYLSELPRPGAQTERFVRDLWLAGEGIGFLREALSAFQEARRSIVLTGQTPTAMTVRRLTATECEFLQGFPRNYTLIPWRKKQAEDCPDGPRYKALGNSMAVNCMEWIGERIDMIEKRNSPGV